ncbi:MAG: hypothetical protein DMF90_03750 [Acidobacteria bacterium]|nr:MAG: hypothetical protein DMF90_03750 [Acidobacteriota bacterium]
MESQCSGSTVAKPPSLRVLVVEDDKLARGALRLILELDGYDVRATGNGLRALRVLKDFNPQMVIMDWRVSGLCGERLCGAIRRRRPNVPLACGNRLMSEDCGRLSRGGLKAPSGCDVDLPSELNDWHTLS